LVFIDYTDDHVRSDCRFGNVDIGSRTRTPIPEPAGVVWRPASLRQRRTGRLTQWRNEIGGLAQALLPALRQPRQRTSEEKRVALETVSEGLRQALGEARGPHAERHAKGVAPDGRL